MTLLTPLRLFPFRSYHAAMVNRAIRTLLDMSVNGLNVKAECRWCNRWRVIDAGRLMWRFHKHGWPIYVEQVAQRLRCAGCGRKDIWISFTNAEESAIQPVRRRGALSAVKKDAPCPEGIDPKQWAKADMRERGRMMALRR